MIKNLQLILVFTLVLSSNVSIASEWYEGGTLHQATVDTWSHSSYSNRLATSGDWFIRISKAYNPELKRKIDALPNSQYLPTLKKFSAQLEKCVSDTINIESFSKESDKAAEIASICYVTMYSSE